jgi:hypothetical protein
MDLASRVGKDDLSGRGRFEFSTESQVLFVAQGVPDFQVGVNLGQIKNGYRQRKSQGDRITEVYQGMKARHLLPAPEAAEERFGRRAVLGRF